MLFNSFRNRLRSKVARDTRQLSSSDSDAENAPSP